ncbi:hypothetical protein FOS14_06260 [Skermania sp. ID1734]|uniref:hypothetical protein n=1 Tax=Skermania sp. ID1734 TaxID=2597516 RepID=UPI00117BED44|nr:hypothetical protein [Skermania sp. ID1734]TSE00637.1 hypothetical protein FOS14_06260 [Skermania sp. ID1734]
MNTRKLSQLLFLIGLVLAATVLTGIRPAAAAPIDYGNGCTLYPDNRAATLDSLRFRCSWAQQDAIYRNSAPGAVPHGVKLGWVVRPPGMPLLASGIWMGKTFYTGDNGGYLRNRLTGAQLEAWQANVYLGPSTFDGKPAWILDYTPSPTPPLHDEIREITPGVWYGFSWWHGIFQQPQLLTFALA